MKLIKNIFLVLLCIHIFLPVYASVNYLQLLYHPQLQHTIIVLGDNKLLHNSLPENIFIEHFKVAFPPSFNFILGTNKDIIRAQAKSFSFLKNEGLSLFDQLSFLSTPPFSLFTPFPVPPNFQKEYNILDAAFNPSHLFIPHVLGDNRQKAIFLLVTFFDVVKEAAEYTHNDFLKAHPLNPPASDAVQWINDLFFNASYQAHLSNQGLSPKKIIRWQGFFIAYLQKALDSIFLLEYSLQSLLGQLTSQEKMLTELDTLLTNKSYTTSFTIKKNSLKKTSQVSLSPQQTKSLLSSFEKIKPLHKRELITAMDNLKHLSIQKDLVQSLLVYAFANHTFNVFDALSTASINDPLSLRASIHYLTYLYPITGYIELIIKEIIREKNVFIFLPTEQCNFLIPSLITLGYKALVAHESTDALLNPEFFSKILNNYRSLIASWPLEKTRLGNFDK